MRTCSGVISTLLVGLGIWMLPERVVVLELPITMRISSVVLPLLVSALGLTIFAWNFKQENEL